MKTISITNEPAFHLAPSDCPHDNWDTTRTDQCPECGVECEHEKVTTNDIGIGLYEFWGTQLSNVQWQSTCDDCGADVTELMATRHEL